MRQVSRPMMALLVALVAGAALIVAGCGSSSDTTSSSSGGGGSLYGSGGSGSSTTASSQSGAGGDGVVSVASNPKLGKIIVTSKGFTLYDFSKDKGTKSACYGGCAKVWPPLLSSGAPKAEGGAQASKLGTTKRTDGTTQVTYAGHPVYTYTADTKPGDANGQNTYQVWFVLSAKGTPIRTK